jgi:predicted ferric reductase
MKKILLKLSTYLFKIFSLFFISFPIKNKITIFTRLNNLTIDVKILYEQLNKEFKDYKV